VFLWLTFEFKIMLALAAWFLLSIYVPATFV